MKQFSKKYQVWESGEYEQFMFKEFDTLEECIMAAKTGDWYVTKKVSLSISDAEVITPSIPYVQPKADEIKPIPTPAELDAEQLAAKYAAGPIGNIIT